MQKMMTEDGKEMMKMGRMMMMHMMDRMMGRDQESQGESEHSQHH
jgi:hypothetical protein